MGSFSCAFRQMARELRATAEPVGRMLDRLEDGPAKSYLTGESPEIADNLPEDQRNLIRETADLLGGYDAATQSNALERAALLLEEEKTALDRCAPVELRTKQSLLLAGAAAAVILLL